MNLDDADFSLLSASNVSITGGVETEGQGGVVTITAGDGVYANNGTGGDIVLQAGDGSGVRAVGVAGNGGAVEITAGSALEGVGGAVSIAGGVSGSGVRVRAHAGKL